MSTGDQTFEERRDRYIESVVSDIVPHERNWWQYPAPSYHLTDDYALQHPAAVDANDIAVFKAQKKNWVILVVMLVVAGLLIYIIGENRFGFPQALFLALLLLVVMPFLLDNKPKIMVSRVSLWIYKGDKNISWENILLIFIKEVHGEQTDYFFVVHYYDESDDQFKKIEIELNGLVSPAILASTINKFKPRT